MNILFLFLHRETKKIPSNYSQMQKDHLYQAEHSVL